MFEKASKLKLRFESNKGLLSVEDLWDLPLTSTTGKANLDDVARAVHRQMKSDDAISFVNASQKTDEVTQLKMDIVKHVIAAKMAENELAAKARDIREKKQLIMEIMARKQNEALANSSMDDLQKMLDSL